MIETVCCASDAAGPISCGASLAAIVAEKMLAAASTTQREAVKDMISPRCFSQADYPGFLLSAISARNPNARQLPCCNIALLATAPRLDFRKLDERLGRCRVELCPVSIVFQ